MAAEAQLERAIAKWLKEEGLYSIKAHGSVYAKRGMPDRLIFVPIEHGVKWSVPLFVECKAPKKKLTRLQAKRFQELRDIGLPAVVVWSLDDLRLAIARLRVMRLVDWKELYNFLDENQRM